MIREVIKNTVNQNTIIAKSQIQDFNTKSILFVMPGEEAVFINDGEIVGILIGRQASIRCIELSIS